MKVQLGRRRFVGGIGAAAPGALVANLLSGCVTDAYGQTGDTRERLQETKVAAPSAGGYMADVLKPGSVSDLAPAAGADPQEELVSPEQGIGLCLSGGGYRAMLFHVGALWRLNDAGMLAKLKRVSSVSGGSITAGVLAMNWGSLHFGADGVTTDFQQQVVNPTRRLAQSTIDAASIIGGFLTPGFSISDQVEQQYRDILFQANTLQDLPDNPRFVFNATNVQTTALWRFSKPFMGDYHVGLVNNPTVPLSKVVTASSAFPPVLSPCHLDLRSFSSQGHRGADFQMGFPYGRFRLRSQPVNATHYSLSNQRSVADETSDLLHGGPESADVGALAEG